MDIIKYFIEHPERWFHVRELAKISKKSPSSVSKYLKSLEKEKLLISEKKLNHLFFKANNENSQFKDKKLYFNLVLIRKSGVIEQLKDFYNPQVIVLFGSFRKAENIEKSDIDLLLVTSSKKKIKLDRFEKKLKHKIQLFLFSKEELNEMKIKNKELLNNLLNGISLEGYWEVFE
jgi:predicted nucleotidyltransferase